MPGVESTSPSRSIDQYESRGPDPEDLVCRAPDGVRRAEQASRAETPSVALEDGAVESTSNACEPPEPVCRAPAAPAPLPAGAASLVSSHSRPLRPPPAPRPPPTDSSAQRTTAMPVDFLHADAGVTSSGDSAYAEAALVKGRYPSGLEVEFLDASIQGGLQNEARIAVWRVSASTSDGVVSGGVEGPSLAAHAGIHNADGSVGLNLGAGASWLGGEASCQDGHGISAGAGFGVALGGHVGLRDGDDDGKTELCAGVELTEGKAQLCLELPVSHP